MKFKTVLACALLMSSFAFAQEPVRYFGQSEQGYRASQPYGVNEKAGHYAQSADAEIWYEIYGKGEPVVVLHGGMVGSVAEMGEFIDELAKTKQVIAISTRGHGKSFAGGNQSYPQKAEDVLAVLNAAKVQGKVSLLGFSDGGYTALFFGANYPERTAKIVAIGAGEWKKGFVQGTRNPNMTFQDLEKLDRTFWAQQAGIRPEPAKTADWFDSLNETYNHTGVEADVFQKIMAPTLFVVGEKDTNAPLDTVLSAYKMTKNAQLSVIPNANHPVFAENFQAVWTAVKPFLDTK
ncbi:alpha/beta hydrolase [Actinobacillus succinogenes]|uniref:Alpha/beta hydrolase fold n=1 Tax=Actinobacillus succinogenes (strain ATCC 55618 / DSM 22257 / CCUG 43843 / 130Z) TaxID=339671 RepID=A6VKL6_ACTSZ|nr:alpha/beta hydrolase [Actinobacillus succinogenes]ABR73513.1 alpha/beta hydrolase fold [Actinobacillus succinogenes 130Z]PHI40024.1 alpha/beta hydrolase [Actinobacillus succinogenes]